MNKNQALKIHIFLNKFGWEPKSVLDKVSLFENLEKWDKLVKIGEPAVSTLLNHRRYKELTYIGASSVDTLINRANALHPVFVDENRQILATLVEIGQPAIPALTEQLKNGRIQYSKVLFEIGWEPEMDSEKAKYYSYLEKWDKLKEIGESGISELIRLNRWKELSEVFWEPQNPDDFINYYSYLQKWDRLIEIKELAVPELVRRERWSEIIKIGIPAIPVLIDAWNNQSNKSKKHDIAHTLHKLGWIPEDFNTRLEFYYDARMYNDLANEGESGIGILVKRSCWQQLAGLGDIGMQALLKELRRTSNNSNYYERAKLIEAIQKTDWNPVTEEDKVTYYSCINNWDELIKLGSIAVPSLIEKVVIYQSGNIFDNARNALIEIGDDSVSFISMSLNEYLDHNYRSDSTSVRNLAKILIKIGTSSAILLLLEKIEEFYVFDDVLEQFVVIVRKSDDPDVIEAIRNKIDEMLEKIEKGYLYGDILRLLGADNYIIGNAYIKLLAALERPVKYKPMLDFFATSKSVHAVKPLLNIISIPRPGNEEFYKDIVLTIGKIGDKRAIESLRELLSTTWEINHKNGIRQTIDARWIEPQILVAINMLENNDRTDSLISS